MSLYHVPDKIRASYSQALLRYLITHHIQHEGESHRLFTHACYLDPHPSFKDALHTHKNHLHILPSIEEDLLLQSCLSFAEAQRGKQVMMICSQFFPSILRLLPYLHRASTYELPLLFIFTYPENFRKTSSEKTIQHVEASLQSLQALCHFTGQLQKGQNPLVLLQECIKSFTKNPGPCALLFPENLIGDFEDFSPDDFQTNLHTLQPLSPSEKELQELFKELSQAKKPLVLLGGGSLSSDYQQLSTLLKKWKVPVCETLSAKGCLAFDFPYHTGVLLKDRYSLARRLVAESDVLLCLGSSLKDYSKQLIASSKKKVFFLNLFEKSFNVFDNRQVTFLRGDVHTFIQHPLSQGFSSSETGAYLDQVSRFIDEEKRNYVQATFESGELPTVLEVTACLNRCLKPQDFCLYSSKSYQEEVLSFWRVQHHRKRRILVDDPRVENRLHRGLGYQLAFPGTSLYLVMASEDLYKIPFYQKAYQALNLPLNLIVLHESQSEKSLSSVEQTLSSFNLHLESCKELHQLQELVRHYRKKSLPLALLLPTQAYIEKKQVGLWQINLEKRMGLKESEQVSYKSEEQTWHVHFPWDKKKQEKVHHHTHSFDS